MAGRHAALLEHLKKKKAKEKAKMRDVPVSQMREAAAAWRAADKSAAGWLFFSAPNLSIHDRVDDLITEIERLRNAYEGSYEGDKPMPAAQGLCDYAITITSPAVVHYTVGGSGGKDVPFNVKPPATPSQS